MHKTTLLGFPARGSARGQGGSVVGDQQCRLQGADLRRTENRVRLETGDTPSVSTWNGAHGMDKLLHFQLTLPRGYCPAFKVEPKGSVFLEELWCQPTLSATALSEQNLGVWLWPSLSQSFLSGSRWDGDVEVGLRTSLQYFMDSGTKTWNRDSKEKDAEQIMNNQQQFTSLATINNNLNNNTRQSPQNVMKIYSHQYPYTLLTSLGPVYTPATLG